MFCSEPQRHRFGDRDVQLSRSRGSECGPRHSSVEGMISEYGSYQVRKRTSGTERIFFCRMFPDGA